MTKLDEIAINSELVLISLIEGAALVTLADNAIHVMHQPDWIRYFPYILSGLAILLVFWAQSILHAVSFIRWPIRVEHMFLYFISAFLQIIAYSSMTILTEWFFWWTVFSAIAIVMYVLDLYILRDTRAVFEKTPGGVEYIDAIEKRHVYEMKYMVPVALTFNIITCLTIWVFPTFFAPPLIYAIPGTLQLIISLFALYDCMQNFRTRSAMIANLFKIPTTVSQPDNTATKTAAAE